MITSSQITPGMIVSISGKLYRVESSVKVTLTKGQPFIKCGLRSLSSDKVTEKNFKVGQEVEEVSLAHRRLEFLYHEGSDFLCLDIDNLEQVTVPPNVVGDKANFLKEGVELAATFYGETLFSVELPQFLELMVVKVDEASEKAKMANTNKQGVLETGAAISIPPFIESGDIIKVDTKSCEYIQRV